MSNSDAPKPKGTPLGVALLVLVVVAVLGMAALGYVVFSMRGENRRLAEELQAQKVAQERAELERQKAADAERKTVAANRQAEILTQVRSVTNALHRLYVEISRIREEAEGLKTSEDGRRVAVHPELVQQARSFFSVQLPELPQAADVLTRLEAARRTEQQLLSAAGTVHQPEGDVVASTDGAANWARDRLERTEKLSAVLSSLVAESKVRIPATPRGGASMNLDTAMRQAAQGEAAASAAVIAVETVKAKKDADQTKAEAEAERIREQARADAAKIRAEAEALRSAAERELLAKKATEIKETAQAKVDAETVVDEARGIELRKRASDPTIQNRLSPFTSPGTLQIRGKKFVRAYDKTPLSLKEMQGFGALAPTMDGLERLVDIAINNNDKERPRWRLNGKFWSTKPEQMEMVKETQKLLIELGPTLVEMKLLEP